MPNKWLPNGAESCPLVPNGEPAISCFFSCFSSEWDETVAFRAIAENRTNVILVLFV
jgi:hypothetical protein